MVAREQRFQDAQADYLKLVKKGSIDAMPDNEVRAEIEQIMKMCRSWAKKHALTSLETLNTEQMESAVKSLEGTEDRKLASNRAVQLFKDHKLPPRMVLGAVLAREIATWTLEKPFFFLSKSDLHRPKGGMVNAGAVLKWVRETGEHCECLPD